jgi:hypothetical protein
MSVFRNQLTVLSAFFSSVLFLHQPAFASDQNTIELDDPFPPAGLEYTFSGRCGGDKYMLVWKPSFQGGEISSYEVNGRRFDAKAINEFLDKNKNLGGISDIDVKECGQDRLSSIFLISLLKLEGGAPKTSFMKITVSNKGYVTAVAD